MYLWVIKCNYCYRLYKTIVVLRQHKVEKKFRLFFFQKLKKETVILDTCVFNSCLSFPPHLSFLVYLNGFIFLIFKILYKSEDNTNFTAYTKSYSVRSRIWKFDKSSTSNYLYTLFLLNMKT